MECLYDTAANIELIKQNLAESELAEIKLIVDKTNQNVDSFFSSILTLKDFLYLHETVSLSVSTINSYNNNFHRIEKIEISKIYRKIKKLSADDFYLVSDLQNFIRQNYWRELKSLDSIVKKVNISGEEFFNILCQEHLFRHIIKNLQHKVSEIQSVFRKLPKPEGILIEKINERIGEIINYEIFKVYEIHEILKKKFSLFEYNSLDNFTKTIECSIEEFIYLHYEALTTFGKAKIPKLILKLEKLSTDDFDLYQSISLKIFETLLISKIEEAQTAEEYQEIKKNWCNNIFEIIAQVIENIKPGSEIEYNKKHELDLLFFTWDTAFKNYPIPFEKMVVWNKFKCLNILFSDLDGEFIDGVDEMDFLSHFLTNNPQPRIKIVGDLYDFIYIFDRINHHFNTRILNIYKGKYLCDKWICAHFEYKNELTPASIQTIRGKNNSGVGQPKSYNKIKKILHKIETEMKNS